MRSPRCRSNTFHVTILLFVLSACGGSQSGSVTDGTPAEEQANEPDDSNEFQLHASDTADQARGVNPSQIEATATLAAMRFFVINPDTGPIEDIVIKMTDPDGVTYYTAETDALGYAEVLVPIALRYEIEYLSLGPRNIMGAVEVPAGGHQDIRLTLRYRSRRGQRANAQDSDAAESGASESGPTESSDTATSEDGESAPAERRFILHGVVFDSGSATLRRESRPRLDRVLEFMTHRPAVRVRVAGHTDNVGDPESNQQLSEERARAVRDYLVAGGIDGDRIESLGYGDRNPVASNATAEGRQRNRRIVLIER